MRHHRPHDPAGHCRHKAYLLTCEEFDELRTAARGRCGRCGRQDKPLWIDHEHTIGIWAVRGLICPRCNARMREFDACRVQDGKSSAYLAEAWHIGRDFTAKIARKFPRARCPACGQDAAFNSSGYFMRHYDSPQLCAGMGRLAPGDED